MSNKVPESLMSLINEGKISKEVVVAKVKIKLHLLDPEEMSLIDQKPDFRSIRTLTYATDEIDGKSYTKEELNAFYSKVNIHFFYKVLDEYYAFYDETKSQMLEGEAVKN